MKTKPETSYIGVVSVAFATLLLIGSIGGIMFWMGFHFKNTYGTYQGDSTVRLDNGTTTRFINWTHCVYKVGDRMGLIFAENGSLIGGLECFAS